MKWLGRTIWDTRIQGVMGILCAQSPEGPDVYASATFAQVTSDPPRVVVNPNRMFEIERTIRTGGKLSINIMPENAGELVHRLMSMRRREPDKVDLLGLEVGYDEREIPYLCNAHRVISCEVERQLESGDRRLFIARVIESRPMPENATARPLLFSKVDNREGPLLTEARRIATVTGVMDVLKRFKNNLMPPPPADIRKTTYEMAGATEPEIEIIESYDMMDRSRQLTAPAPARDLTRPVGVCVVGTRWGLEHCKWIREGQPKARLFVCGRDEVRTAKVARAAGAEGYFIGLDQAVADDRVEALSLALPHDFHRLAVETVAAAGKHALVEKPIATTLEDADAMIAVARKHNTTLMVAEDMHFRPSVLEAFDRIHAGDVGEPLYMLVHAGGIMRPTGWKQDKDKMGGGVLIDIGVHYIRALRLLLGEPDQVSASRAMQINTRMGGEDSVQLMFSSQVGWEAHMLLSWSSYRGTLPDIVVVGSKGTLTLWPNKKYLEYFSVAPTKIMELLRYVRPYWLQNKLMRPELQRRRIRWKNRPASGYIGEMREFLACVAEGRPPATTPEDGRRDLEIVKQCYRSLEEQGPVSTSMAGNE